jgi:hypothetical protein
LKRASGGKNGFETASTYAERMLNEPAPTVSWLLHLAYLLEMNRDVEAAVDRLSQLYHLDDGTEIRLRSHVKTILQEVVAAATIAPSPSIGETLEDLQSTGDRLEIVINYEGSTLETITLEDAPTPLRVGALISGIEQQCITSCGGNSQEIAVTDGTGVRVPLAVKRAIQGQI